MPGPALIIGKQRYPLADLPPLARFQCQQIEFCQHNINRLQRELALLQQIRTDALQVLPALLPGNSGVEPDGAGAALPKQRRHWPSAPACKPRRY